MITTGEFHSCNISDITVYRETRQRKSLGDILELAQSIKERGLINPITITRSNILVAGERRLAACKYLGWDKIPFQYVDETDLDELEAHEELELIELHENIQRHDLSWKEINDSYARIYEIAKKRNPDLTLEQASRMVGLNNKGNMSAHLLVKQERERNNRINDSATFSSALNITRGIKERREAEEAENLLGCFKQPYTSVLNANFHEWAPSYSGPKFNLIHCDFPYGIDSQDSGVNPSGYDDSLDIFLQLLRTLTIELDRFCAPQAHIIFWFSPKHWSTTWENLKLLDGFTFDDVPLIWHKSDGKGIAPDPGRRPRRVYETAFFGWRGDRKLVRLKDNLFSAPSVSGRHPHEKSELALRHFFEMVVDSGTAILDPTCGSGSALRAARALGASRYLGLERDEETANDARRLFEQANGLNQSEAL